MIFLTIFSNLTCEYIGLKIEQSLQFTCQIYSFAIIEVFNKVVPQPTLVYRIDVHARLLILRKKSPLHGLILVCTFIAFEKKVPPARLFHPARLLVLVCSKLVQKVLALCYFWDLEKNRISQKSH